MMTMQTFVEGFYFKILDIYKIAAVYLCGSLIITIGLYLC